MKAKKIVNERENIVHETIAGFVKSQNGRLKWDQENNVVVRSELEKGKIGIVMGNGAGHEPDAIGYVGKNFMDANAIGGLFAAPGPFAIEEAIKAADTGAGVIVLVCNCAGDVLNSKMAVKMAKNDGINVGKILLCGTCVTDPDTGRREDRQGGGIICNKMICGYASYCNDMQKIIDFANDVLDNTRSISVGIRPGTSPITGEIMYELDEDKITLGVGGHGQAGVEDIPLCSSKELTNIVLDRLLNDKPFVKGAELTYSVCGLGGTTLMEQLIFYNDIYEELERRGYRVYKPIVGTLSTVQESSGLDITITEIANEDMRRTYDLPTDAMAYPAN